MKILTVNINSIRAHIESFIEILASNEYDTILVQELKAEDAAFPHNVFDFYGYNIKVYGQKSWNGVAIFSRESIEDVVRGLPNYPDPNARMIGALVGGRLRIINVYMPNGESIDSPKFPYKIEWMQKFNEYISDLLASEEAVLIGGDFNVAIEDRDVYKPKSYEGSSISAPAARAEMQKWLDSGWRDTWRHFNPDITGYTWYGYRGSGNQLEKNQGLRLDYFLANHVSAKLVKNCNVDDRPRRAKKPTDHCGLAIEIDI